MMYPLPMKRPLPLETCTQLTHDESPSLGTCVMDPSVSSSLPPFACSWYQLPDMHAPRSLSTGVVKMGICVMGPGFTFPRLILIGLNHLARIHLTHRR